MNCLNFEVYTDSTDMCFVIQVVLKREENEMRKKRNTEKRNKIQLFPTPESPIIINLNK